MKTRPIIKTTSKFSINSMVDLHEYRIMDKVWVVIPPEGKTILHLVVVSITIDFKITQGEDTRIEICYRLRKEGDKDPYQFWDAYEEGMFSTKKSAQAYATKMQKTGTW